MSGGTIAAASGMKAQMEALDILANNLANMNTVGFKEQKSFFTILSDSINSTPSNGRNPLFPNETVQTNAALNLADGTLQPTKSDLDVALVGDGFLEVSTPRGIRFTRSGSLSVNAKSQLVTVDGYPVMGKDGPILVGPGKLSITEKGEVFVNKVRVGGLKIVSPDTPAMLVKEGHSLLIPSDPKAQAKPGTAVVRQGFLEQSNVNAVASMVDMVEIMRRYEAIQKTVNLLLNDVDAKSIEKLGR